MAKLKWKKGTINLCTPLLKRHVVKGYIHGQLGVYKEPDSKPTQWGITHIKTGLNAIHGMRRSFRLMTEVKEFASRMMKEDSWYIEGAVWGDAVDHNRTNSLAKVLCGLLDEDGYKADYRKYNPADKEVVRYLCSCGKAAERYILSIGKKKWAHRCLECEPHVKT